MRTRDFQKARAACVAANREVVEHRLAEVYRLMDWQPFTYIVYTQSPTSFKWSNRRNDWYYNKSSLSKRRLALLRAVNADSYKRGDDPWKDLYPDPKSLHRCPKGARLAEAWNSLTKELMDLEPHTTTPVVLEKPVEVHFDAAGQLHRTDGPTVIWRDGRKEWWFNGVKATQRFIEKPPTLAYINSQTNAERRRILIERFGEENYLKKMRAKLRHEDETGRLWRIERRKRWVNVGGWNSQEITPEPIQFIEVVNSTPEPDGSFNKYFLRVPPTMSTARQAVAWTFRVPVAKSGAKYRPKAQT